MVGLGQHRRIGAARIDVPRPGARIVVERARLYRAAAAVGHLEPPGLEPRRALTLDLAQDDGGAVGRIELEALVDREGFGPAGIDEAAVFVADEHGRPGRVAPEQGRELAQTFLIGLRPGIGREARRLGQRRADRHDEAQARRQEALDRAFERRHALADAARLEMIDGPPAQPQQRQGKRQHDQRHQRNERDAEGNRTPRFFHFIQWAGQRRNRFLHSCPAAQSLPLPGCRVSPREGRAACRRCRRWRRRPGAPPRTARAGQAPRRPRTAPARCCARGSPRCW